MKTAIKFGLISSLALAPTLSHAHQPLSAPQRNLTNIQYQDDWMDRIKLSALFMSEVMYSDHDQSPSTRFNDSNSWSVFCFPRANVYLDSQIAQWIHAHMGFRFIHSCGFGSKNDETSFFRFSNRIDDVHLTFKDFNRSPFWGRLGVQHVAYGDYERNVIPAPLTQLLTQSQVAAATVGYQQNGFEATGYVFNGKKHYGRPTQINNGGVQLGYGYGNEQRNAHITVDWMSNIAGGVNYIVHSSGNPLNTSYRNTVGGLHTGIHAQHDCLDMKAQYTTALNHFNVSDLSYKSRGARPSGWMIDGGYTIKYFPQHPVRIGVSLQRTNQSVNIRGTNLGLPKQRVQVDSNVEVYPNINTGLHLIFDKDYTEADGGTGKSSFTTMWMIKAHIV